MDSKDEEALLDNFHLAEHRQRLQHEHEAFSHENTPDDEQRLIHVLEQAEEQAGGILAFDLVPFQDRPCRHSNVRHRVFPAQLPEPNLASALPRHRLGNAPERAFTEAIDRQLATEPTLEDDATLFIIAQSYVLGHAYQLRCLSLGEWRQQTKRPLHVMESLACRVSSSEGFKINHTFTLSLSIIRPQGRGGKGTRLGSKPIELLLNDKRSIVTIKTQDEFCCARALVTMKTYADEQGAVQRDASIAWLRQGRPIQERLTKALHCEARVPEDPSRPGKLDLFQIALPDYHIKVFDAERCYMVW